LDAKKRKAKARGKRKDAKGAFASNSPLERLGRDQSLGNSDTSFGKEKKDNTQGGTVVRPRDGENHKTQEGKGLVRHTKLAPPWHGSGRQGRAGTILGRGGKVRGAYRSKKKTIMDEEDSSSTGGGTKNRTCRRTNCGGKKKKKKHFFLGERGGPKMVLKSGLTMKGRLLMPPRGGGNDSNTQNRRRTPRNTPKTKV